MDVTVKLKFGATSPRLEKFGLNKYIIYLASQEGDSDIGLEIRTQLSKLLGVPPGKIVFKKRDINGNSVFEI
ncbi:MAG: hypothetical protein WCK90_03785 [archaeon]